MTKTADLVNAILDDPPKAKRILAAAKGQRTKREKKNRQREREVVFTAEEAVDQLERDRRLADHWKQYEQQAQTRRERVIACVENNGWTPGLYWIVGYDGERTIAELRPEFGVFEWYFIGSEVPCDADELAPEKVLQRVA